jgi:hypothetical protein
MGDDISADWPDEEPDHPTEETDAESGEIEDATEAPELDESTDAMDLSHPLKTRNPPNLGRSPSAQPLSLLCKENQSRNSL